MHICIYIYCTIAPLADQNRFHPRCLTYAPFRTSPICMALFVLRAVYCACTLPYFFSVLWFVVRQRTWNIAPLWTTIPSRACPSDPALLHLCFTRATNAASKAEVAPVLDVMPIQFSHKVIMSCIEEIKLRGTVHFFVLSFFSFSLVLMRVMRLTLHRMLCLLCSLCCPLPFFLSTLHVRDFYAKNK